MRTALYVLAPTTVTFGPSPAPVAKVARFGDKSPSFAAEGQVALEPGIYFIQSSRQIPVMGEHIETDFTISEKDAWPDPPKNLRALEGSPTVEEIQAFFLISKDLEL
jgi:hypothetical protein